MGAVIPFHQIVVNLERECGIEARRCGAATQFPGFLRADGFRAYATQRRSPRPIPRPRARGRRRLGHGDPAPVGEGHDHGFQAWVQGYVDGSAAEHSNFATRPFCRKNPKTMPVSRPRIRFSGVSNMLFTLIAVKRECRSYRGRCEHRNENPARNGELQPPTDAVATRAPLRKSRPEHHHRRASKRARITFRGTRSETPRP